MHRKEEEDLHHGKGSTKRVERERVKGKRDRGREGGRKMDRAEVKKVGSDEVGSYKKDNAHTGGRGERVSGPTEIEGVMARMTRMDEGGKRGSE